MQGIIVSITILVAYYISDLFIHSIVYPRFSHCPLDPNKPEGSVARNKNWDSLLDSIHYDIKRISLNIRTEITTSSSSS